jgi:hypothetical protein
MRCQIGGQSKSRLIIKTKNYKGNGQKKEGRGNTERPIQKDRRNITVLCKDSWRKGSLGSREPKSTKESKKWWNASSWPGKLDEDRLVVKATQKKTELAVAKSRIRLQQVLTKNQREMWDLEQEEPIDYHNEAIIGYRYLILHRMEDILNELKRALRRSSKPEYDYKGEAYYRQREETSERVPQGRPGQSPKDERPERRCERGPDEASNAGLFNRLLVHKQIVGRETTAKRKPAEDQKEGGREGSQPLSIGGLLKVVPAYLRGLTGNRSEQQRFTIDVYTFLPLTHS